MMVALTACAALTACDRGIVDSGAPAAAAMLMPENPYELPYEPIDPLDPGGDGGGGGGYTPPPPFAPPGAPFAFANDLTYNYYSFYAQTAQCGQPTHAFWGFSNDVTQGTTIYLSGITAPNYPMIWGVYNQWGQRVRTHQTQGARSNCVVHHEPEGLSTAGLAPGYYYLYASYMALTPYVTVYTYGYTGAQLSNGYLSPLTGQYVGALRVR
jgi:hypothetical protein